ncbi:replication-associated protein [Circular genetic element sp.]|nr:replication-associated protein [Circular genetic element sp.]
MPSKDRTSRMTFTWNHYDDSDVERLKSKDVKGIKYIVFGFEIGEMCGTPHLQGYVEWTEAISFGAACQRFEPLSAADKRHGIKYKVYFLKAHGSQEANFEYCTCTGDKYGPGCCEDKSHTRDPYYILVDEDEEDYQYFENPPWHTKALKYNQDCFIGGDKDKMSIDRAQRLFPANMRMLNWQRELVNMVTDGRPPEGRRIVWVHGKKGAEGKTVLAAWLFMNANALFLNNSKTADMAYAYDDHEIVCIDLTKSAEEVLNISAIEALKNGLIFSGKYHSKAKIGGVRPWVIVFSNSSAPLDSMAQKRFFVIPIQKNPRLLQKEPNEVGLLQDFVETCRKNDFRKTKFLSLVMDFSDDEPGESKASPISPSLEYTSDYSDASLSDDDSGQASNHHLPY